MDAAEGNYEIFSKNALKILKEITCSGRMAGKILPEIKMGIKKHEHKEKMPAFSKEQIVLFR